MKKCIFPTFTIFIVLLLLNSTIPYQSTEHTRTAAATAFEPAAIVDHPARASPVLIDSFADGSKSLVLNLTGPDPGGGYYNASAALRVPRSVQIQSVSMDVEGQSLPIPDNVINSIDFNDAAKTEAYAGSVFDDPPQGPLPGLMAKYRFNTLHRTNISAKDSKNVTNVTEVAAARAYHLFQFDLSAEVFNAVNISWFGHGELSVKPAYYNAKMFYWTGSVFELIAIQTGGGGKDQQIDSILGNKNLLDQDGNLHVIVISPEQSNSTVRAMIYTNYIMVQTLKNGTGVSYPYNLSVDMASDDAVELTIEGELSSTVQITQNLVGALQSAVDDAESGYGDAIVGISFHSERRSRLHISNLQIQYTLDVKPELVKSIPNSTELDEDSIWATTDINVTEYFKDGFGDGNLSYVIGYKQDESELDARINAGSMRLEFLPAHDFNGVREFNIVALNRGTDGIKGNLDDQGTTSNNFKVTVRPTNDPPRIDALKFSDGHKRVITSNSVRLIQSTESALEDGPLSMQAYASDIDGDNIIFTCNLTDGFGTDDNERMSLNPVTGVLLFDPNCSDVGTLHLNLTVSDLNGTDPLEGFLKVELHVHPWNDPPVIETEGPLVAYEDRMNYLQIVASDEESMQILYRSNITDIQDPDYRSDIQLDRDTGLIEFEPNQQDVGTLFMNVSVEDEDGKRAYRELQIHVVNVNDPPRFITVGNMAALKSDLMLFQVLESTWLNLSVKCADEDDDALTFAATPLPPSVALPSNFTLDSATGTISFRAMAVELPSLPDYYINITADDGNNENGTGYVWLEIQVQNSNDAPRINNVTYSVTDGRVTFKLDAEDPDGDPLRVIWSFGDGSPVVVSYGLAERNHAYPRPGAYNVKVTVVDIHNASDSYELRLNLTSDDFPTNPVPQRHRDDEGLSGMLLAAMVIIIISIIALVLIISIIVRRRRSRLTDEQRKELRRMFFQAMNVEETETDPDRARNEIDKKSPVRKGGVQTRLSRYEDRSMSGKPR